MTDEKRPVVAFLGPEGSYTHQAALDAFPPSSSSSTTPVTLHPEITIEDVFSAVQSGTAYRGVVPFENSSNGSVVFTLDLFADLNNKYPDILVCDEAYVAVKHCLVGYKRSSHAATTTTTTTTTAAQQDDNNSNSNNNNNNINLSHIKKLYSHPQAWGQCKLFLSTHLKTAERHDVSSTSKAAEIACLDTSGESAALSSMTAAELFSLDVLAREINDRKGNSTRFFVLRRRERGYGCSGDDEEEEEEEREGEGEREKEREREGQGETVSWKSLLTFTIPHATTHHPGALANCLTVFSEHGISLTSINTRPSGVRNWHYVFFVEFKGRFSGRRRGGGEGGGGGGVTGECGGDGIGDDNVDKALSELDKVCRGWRWLGSWKNRLEEEE